MPALDSSDQTSGAVAEPTEQPAPAADSVDTTPVTVSERPRSTRRFGAVKAAGVALAIALTFGVGVGVGRIVPADLTGGAAPSGAPAASGANLALITEAWDAIHQNYVDAKNLDD